MDGFISLLKPPGMTSSDAVLFIRRMLPKSVKTGHCGTLDPEASGVLVISVGKATRLFDYVIDEDKEYIATVKFGLATDTQDATGRVTQTADKIVRPDEVKRASAALTGEIYQTPPMYSAIKRDGKRLYSMARAGESVDVEPRRVTVESIDYIGQLAQNEFMIRVTCRKGVYIRTLCHDMGHIVGCPAHMSFLLRSRVGIFTVNEAATVEEIRNAGDAERHLAAMDAPLGYMPMVTLGEDAAKQVLSGNPFFSGVGENKSGLYRVYVGRRFAGVCFREASGKHSFRCMLLSDA